MAANCVVLRDHRQVVVILRCEPLVDVVVGLGDVGQGLVLMDQHLVWGWLWCLLKSVEIRWRLIHYLLNLIFITQRVVLHGSHISAIRATHPVLITWVSTSSILRGVHGHTALLLKEIVLVAIGKVGLVVIVHGLSGRLWVLGQGRIISLRVNNSLVILIESSCTLVLVVVFPAALHLEGRQVG